MKAYVYNEKNGEFVREAVTDLDPLETRLAGKNVWLLPAHSTFTPPPAAGEKQAAVWNGAKWEIVEDHRRKRDKGGVIIKESGTAYWLPGDTWESPARYMTELGPLPDDAILARPEKPAPTLDEAKAAKLAEINAQCDALLKSLVATYPETEQQTFYKQDAESAAYLADASAKTPFLTGLAAARGISLEEMVHRVRAKTDAFVALSASVCGQRQAMEDALDACETVEAVQALAVSYQTAG